jgi:carbon-monoxide dehydrogenase small subunit
MEIKAIKFVLNGKPCEVQVEPNKRLLDMIREDLGLTGTKEGCGLGECGACTVIMGGKAVNSCLILAVEADKQEITTIEGLADGDGLHHLQQAFVAHGGMQCGFCTSGMIMSAKALLDTNSHPTEMEIKDAIAGNFCRCTGYTKIIESIEAAAEEDLAKDSKGHTGCSCRT